VPRAIWSGSISFGLVTIPIKLYNAVSRKTVRFNQLDGRSGSRIKYQKVSASDGTEVPADSIVRGYEYTKGQYVLVNDEEIQSVAPKAGRSVDIEAFVGLEEIDPIWFDGAYYVAPAEGFEKAYMLLVEAMDEEGRVALARFVRSNKQYLAAIRPHDGYLQLATMVYADEIVPASNIPEFERLADVELSEAEMAMARQLIGSLHATFEPEKYRDTHREELVALLERKAAGEEIVTVVPEVDDANVVDLLAALEASVAAAKAGRSRRGSGTRKAAGKKAAAKKPTARKSGSKKSATNKTATNKTALGKTSGGTSAGRKTSANRSAAGKSATGKSATKKSATKKSAVANKVVTMPDERTAANAELPKRKSA